MTKWQKEKLLIDDLYAIVSPKLSNFAKERSGIVRATLRAVIESGYRKVEETK